MQQFLKHPIVDNTDSTAPFLAKITRFSFAESASFFLPPALYVVATPIGNYEDITLRAITILSKADLIICEDSRISAKLLDKLQIKKPLIIYNDQSTNKDRKKILQLILDKKSLALISDAGTPLISDPGYKLVSTLLDNNIKVISIPGPCSVISALSISGIASDRFLFAGFIPNSKIHKTKFFQELALINSSLIFFETAKRIADSLEVMLEVLGNRTASVVREITKIYEETKKDSLENLVSYYQQNPIKGEIVILVAPPQFDNQPTNFDLIDQELKDGLDKMRPKDLVSLVANHYQINKKIIYQRMIGIIKNKKD